jgi:mycothiol synthase
MRLVEVVRARDAEFVDAVRAFLTADAAQSGRRHLSDHLWLDLLNGGGSGFIGVRLCGPDGQARAYAQISAAAGGAQLEAVGNDPAERLDVAETALDAFAADGGGAVTWWVDDTDPATAQLAAAHGMTPARQLHEMRRPLPADEHATIATRAFRPNDADAWLAVNNRAFSGHPEQGGWTAEVLAARVAEPWFDPQGFRLYEADADGSHRLAGFCWTKVHPPTATDPRLGEIYVIAVDPDFGRRGLGRELTLAGLDSLSERGIGTACLYVDAANSAAFELYRRLGFHVHRTRTAFSGDLPKAPA